MVDDIITGLSRIKWLFVIARNSTFTYKGHAVDLKQVGRELGVRYVLEGSVHKLADRVRITGQLIDAVTGAHIWAERYDRKVGSARFLIWYWYTFFSDARPMTSDTSLTDQRRVTYGGGR
jgi:TolB-like protein